MVYWRTYGAGCPFYSGIQPHGQNLPATGGFRRFGSYQNVPGVIPVLFGVLLYKETLGLPIKIALGYSWPWRAVYFASVRGKSTKYLRKEALVAAVS